MKSIFFLLAFVVTMLAEAQVWQERFDGLSNGSVSDAGATSWTTTFPAGGAASFSKQTPVPGYELFLINDTGSEGVWQSGIINISAQTKVAVEITLYSYFTFSTDYIRCYYKINGGEEVQFGELQGNSGLNIISAASAIVSGNTLQIIVKAMDNTSGTTSGYINALAFDDITVTGISVLYSRTSGNWNNTNTWSLGGFSGASCGCTPSNNTEVVVGNNSNVSMPSASTAAGVTVENTGRLLFTANTTLTMARGGRISIDTGGELKNSGGNGSLIYGAYSYSIVNNGTIAISTITANAGSLIGFSGSGSWSVTDFLINTNRMITLNTSGGFLIGNDLSFQAPSSNGSLVNQQTLTIGNRILFASGNMSLVNSSSITAGSIVVNASTNNGNVFTNAASGILTVGAINLNNGDFRLDNAGTINQTGNFSNIDNGSSFNNLNGSTWNFSGAGTHNRLFCNNGTNTFNYSAFGAQNVFVPADGYSALTISGSGIKTLTGNLDINSNLTIEGTAQLDISSSQYALTIGGNWSTSSTHADPFVERTGTVTLDGTTDQTISAVSGTETFFNLAVNKTTGNVVQSAEQTTDVVVSNVLTLTNGGLSINGRTLTITNNSPAAIARTNGYIISETNTFPYSRLQWDIGTATGSYVFPFGKTRATADYIPFTFNITSPGTSATGTVSVITYSTASNNLPLPNTVTNMLNASGADNSANLVDRFWFITLGGYTVNPTTTVNFSATPGEVGSIGNLKAQRWNSSSLQWEAPKDGQTNPTSYSATVPGVSNFSPWALSGNNMILPVDLIYFKASLKDNAVNIEWKTAQEHNNDFYSVQKSVDPEYYFEIARVKGAGTSSESHSYRATDPNPFEGKTYYRLKQTDLDGKVTYFKPVMIEYGGNKSKTLTTHPVPFHGSEINIVVQGMKAGETVPLEILDMNGHALYRTSVQADLSGKVDQKLAFVIPFLPGVYILKIGTGYLIKKIVVE